MDTKDLMDTMDNKTAAVIIGNMPIVADECYSISEYQVAKAKAIDTLLRTVEVDALSKEDVFLCLTGDITNDTLETYVAKVQKKLKNLEPVSIMVKKSLLEKVQQDVADAYDRGYNDAKKEFVK